MGINSDLLWTFSQIFVLLLFLYSQYLCSCYFWMWIVVCFSDKSALNGSPTGRSDTDWLTPLSMCAYSRTHTLREHLHRHAADWVLLHSPSAQLFIPWLRNATYDKLLWCCIWQVRSPCETSGLLIYDLNVNRASCGARPSPRAAEQSGDVFWRLRESRAPCEVLSKNKAH